MAIKGDKKETEYDHLVINSLYLCMANTIFKVRDCCECFVYKYTHELNV